MSNDYISDPFLGEIRIFAGLFAPKGWAMCDGHVLKISDHPKLFSVIGSTFGGDGRVTFGVPELSGCAPMHPGQTPGGIRHVYGERGGSEESVVYEDQLPVHRHQLQATRVPANNRDPQGNVLADVIDWYSSDEPENLVEMAAGCIAPAGGAKPHANVQPSLGLRFIIALEGTYPERSAESGACGSRPTG